MTREAFEKRNYYGVCFGGSTNAVMHLIAMAHSVDIEITLKDFQDSDKTPLLADLKPSGKYLMEDLHTKLVVFLQ
jgi:dihydroxy-acid dehydratase